MRVFTLGAAVLGGLILMVPAAMAQDPAKPLTFPDAGDGRMALTVDLHTHSVFSDGAVWPTIRVQEAERDGLALLAVTEHLEWQPYLADIPHPDRNRAFEVAKVWEEYTDVIVVNGAEITRGMPVGHINAVFIDDANPILPDIPSASTYDELRARFDGASEKQISTARASLEAANAQDAFVFMNHLAWTGQAPDGIARLTDFHKQAIEDGLIHGIEVVNGAMYMEDAFNIALDYNLAIVGVSDIHGLIAWDYASDYTHLGMDGAGPTHRTATIVLTEAKSAEAIQDAIEDRQTVGVQANTLYGRAEPLSAVVTGALTATLGPADQWPGTVTTVHPMEIVNTAPIPLTIRSTSDQGFYGHPRTFTIPARGSVTVRLTAVDDADALTRMPIEILNAYIAPEAPLALDLTIGRAEE